MKIRSMKKQLEGREVSEIISEIRADLHEIIRQMNEISEFSVNVAYTVDLRANRIDHACKELGQEEFVQQMNDWRTFLNSRNNPGMDYLWAYLNASRNAFRTFEKEILPVLKLNMDKFEMAMKMATKAKPEATQTDTDTESGGGGDS